MKMTNGYEKSVDKTYLTVDEAFKVIKEKVKDEIPVPEIQPIRFSVHACADPSKILLFNSHPSYLAFLSKSKVIHIMKLSIMKIWML
jgi:plastocyanin domain-containing protein